MINYKSGDLFSAPARDVLLHTCNCQGSWGSGVALGFKRRFSKSYIEYQRACRNGRKPGDILLIEVERPIVCLFTSNHYGKLRDTSSEILRATEVCLKKMEALSLRNISSPKINAGLFAVLWEKTEALILNYLKNTQTQWSVWSLEENQPQRVRL